MKAAGKILKKKHNENHAIHFAANTDSPVRKSKLSTDKCYHRRRKHQSTEI